MNSKLVLCLVLVLSVLWIGCAKAKQGEETIDADLRPLPKTIQGEIWNKTLLTNWTDTKITLYRESGDVVQLDAKKAIYRIWTNNNWAGNHSSVNTAVVAFVDPQNGMVWLGSANTDKDFKVLDFYVESDSGIFSADNNLFAGELCGHKTLMVKAYRSEDLSAVIGRFEKGSNGWCLLEQCERRSLSPFFSNWFFYPHVMVSFVGSTPIQSVEVRGGKMRLDFTSPALHTPGSVWIDLKTWKLVKAVEDGKRVYPKYRFIPFLGP